MRKINLTLFAVLSFVLFFPGPSNAGSLIITGVIDGPLSGGTPKAVELYAIEEITNLSSYGLGFANNGGGTDGEEFTFDDGFSATAGEFIYIAYESVNFTEFFGFPPDDTCSAAEINGDDAIELFQDGGVIDVFGDIGADGTGAPWEYLDGWAYRKNGTSGDMSTFNLANWFFSGPNALDGESTNHTADVPMPVGHYKTSAVPLPSTVLLFGAGVAGLLGSRLKKPKRRTVFL